MLTGVQGGDGERLPVSEPWFLLSLDHKISAVTYIFSTPARGVLHGTGEPDEILVRRKLSFTKCQVTEGELEGRKRKGNLLRQPPPTATQECRSESIEPPSCHHPGGQPELYPVL